MNKLAPVVVFVYRRADNTKKVLQSLSECEFAYMTELYIFSDAAKNIEIEDEVQAVRAVIHDKKWKSIFKSVNIDEADVNRGLANSVIQGVSKVIEQYGKVIVVEDDNVVSSDFLAFMNGALDFYEDDPMVGHIGGYTMPIQFPSDYNHDVYLMGRGSSYSWATWKKYWEKVDWEVKDYDQFKKSKKLIRAFNAYGNTRSKMLDAQINGKIDSWAIRFSYYMFRNNLFAILPVKTRVVNNGYGEKSTHNTGVDKRFISKFDDDLKPVKFEHVQLDDRIVKAYSKQLSISSLPVRVWKRIIKKIRADEVE